MVIAAIGLGSNIGDAPGNVREAMTCISSIAKVEARSDLYFSKAWGITDQSDFCNAAVLIETDRSPHTLLQDLKSIEQIMGRMVTKKWGPRLIDLDILLYGDQTLNSPNLKIPHPYMLERAFVLFPLAQLDSRFHKSLSDLALELREQVWRGL